MLQKAFLDNDYVPHYKKKKKKKKESVLSLFFFKAILKP